MFRLNSGVTECDSFIFLTLALRCVYAFRLALCVTPCAYVGYVLCVDDDSRDVSHIVCVWHPLLLQRGCPRFRFPTHLPSNGTGLS
jgi:hypothetical protein